MKHILLSSLLLLAVSQLNAQQLVINEISQGTSGNKEYVELVVKGTRSCGDTSADLRGWIVDDNCGWFGTAAISQGCYRFANTPSWSNVPYGSIILIYNDGDKNGLITQADDPTDVNRDGVYILPVTSSVLELNGATPVSGGGPTYTYPTTGFSASTSWNPMALNNNGDAIVVVAPGSLSTAYHSVTYGNVSGGNVHISSSGGQKVFYVNGDQYNSTAGWVAGSAPGNETPGAPNNTANGTWINSMRAGAGGSGPYNDTTVVNLCQGQSYVFNGNTYTATGFYTFTFPKPGGCDSVVTLKLTVSPIPAAPVVTSPLSFCQQDIPSTLTATGQNLLWYSSFTGGTGTATPPVPSTATTGMTSYYVSQTVNGCESPRSELIVKVKTKPAAPIATTPVTYCQFETALPLIAAGNNLQWYTTPTGGIPVATPPIPNTVVSGNFTWYVTQTDSACESDRSIIAVTVHEIDAIFTVSKDTICSLDTLQLASLSTGAGLTYSWNFGDGNTDNTAAPSHIYQAAGNYTITLTVTNSNGCIDSVKKIVTVLPFPTLFFQTDKDVYCQGQSASITSNVSPYYQSITWDFGDGTRINGDENPQHSYDTSGTFVISVQTINKGCPDRNFSDTITVHSFPMVNIGEDTTLCPGNKPIALSNKSPELMVASYQWNTGATTPGILATVPGIYWLEVSNGQCSNTDSVEIFKSCYIDIPNSFSPNGDGLNDYFFPRQFLTRQLTEFDMQIFNRWGEKIYETKSLDGRGWDGDFNGNGQPQGVYIYLITAGFANGVHEKYQGNVTLIR